MGFDGIDKPINNSQIGVSLADLEADDLHYKLKCLIKNALETTGFTPMSEESVIEAAITMALQEFSTILVPPMYLPDRNYLATPVCPHCSSQMQLMEENGSILFKCIARNCKHQIPGEIV